MEMKEKRILRFLDKIRLEMSWIAYVAYCQCSLYKCAKIEMRQIIEIRKMFGYIFAYRLQ